MATALIGVGSTGVIKKGLSRVCAQGRVNNARLSSDLIPYQEECLQRFKRRIEATYDSSNPKHLEILRALWDAAFPRVELHGLLSEQWKEMGWQGKDPATDFRGGGLMSLENLFFFAKTYPKSFQNLLLKQDGHRATWEYPFAIAGVNITFMLIQMLELKAENEWAFDILYCITFKLMDQHWLAMNASYMDFNSVLRSTRHQLEKEMLLTDISRVEEIPSYYFLQ